jgi:hypothetical protein
LKKRKDDGVCLLNTTCDVNCGREVSTAWLNEEGWLCEDLLSDCFWACS